MGHTLVSLCRVRLLHNLHDDAAAVISVNVLRVRCQTYDDDNVVLYSAVAPCYCSMPSALGRVESSI